MGLYFKLLNFFFDQKIVLLFQCNLVRCTFIQVVMKFYLEEAKIIVLFQQTFWGKVSLTLHIYCVINLYHIFQLPSDNNNI